jgi:hypothetical protein
MRRTTLGLAFAALAILVLASSAAVADDSYCGGCNDGCTEFLGQPVCGTAFGSCEGCQVWEDWDFSGWTLSCHLYSCDSGDGHHGPYHQMTQRQEARPTNSPCQMAQETKKSYRVLRIEVLSARS